MATTLVPPSTSAAIDALREATKFGLSERAEQIAFASSFADWFAHTGDAPMLTSVRELQDGTSWTLHWPHILASQGAAGVGKSLALLAIATSIGTAEHPVIIATWSRALLEQLRSEATTGKTAELLCSINGVAPKVNVRLGRSNFVDIDRLHWRERERKMRQHDTTDEWDAFLAWANDPATDGVIASWLTEQAGSSDLPIDPLSRMPLHLWQICCDSTSSEAALAKFLAHQSEASEASDIILTTQASLVISRLWGDRAGDVLPPSPALVIIDEADHLPESVRLALNRRIDLDSLAARTRQLTDLLRSNEDASALEAITSLRVALIDALDAVRPGLERDRRVLWDNRRFHLVHAVLGNLGVELDSLSDHRDQDIAGLSHLIRTDISALDSSSGGQVPVVSTTPVRGWITVAVNTRDIRTPIRKVLGADSEAPAAPIALVSATITGAYGMSALTQSEDDRIRAWLGYELALPAEVRQRVSVANTDASSFGSLDELVLLATEALSPWNASSNARSYAPGWIRDVRGVIEMLASGQVPHTDAALSPTKTVAPIRALVLAPSVAELETLDLASMEAVYVHSPRAESLASAWRQALESGARIFATPSGWEGFNALTADGDTWATHIVVTRLPISPPPASLLNKAESNYLEMVVQTAKGIRRLTQGLGRGIRRSGDHVSLWLLDPRLPLGDATRKALAIMAAFDEAVDPKILALLERPQYTVFAQASLGLPQHLREFWAHPSLVLPQIGVLDVDPTD